MKTNKDGVLPLAELLEQLRYYGMYVISCESEQDTKDLWTHGSVVPETVIVAKSTKIVMYADDNFTNNEFNIVSQSTKHGKS